MPPPYQIKKGSYPIVYVRGYAMTRSEREETFNDAYYGFSATSVEKRQASPADDYLIADVFEGQMIRFMKMKEEYSYADAANQGFAFHSDPSRSIWISRFYDQDYIRDKVRSIEEHAKELAHLIVNVIPLRLKSAGVQEASIKKDYKVILIAHSMGGLVCRTLLQNILPNSEIVTPDSILAADRIKDPKNLIHRLVTLGTPHKGIDLGNIPDFIENSIVAMLNPFDASIFKESRMRDYLKLEPDEVLHSLAGKFPVKRCLCIIGSDYSAYSQVKHATGSFSDGLVKQDHAYVVDKRNSNNKYGEEQTAFYANVHRAHSGYRGIVNSYESYENIQRFLFGDLMVRISLANLTLMAPKKQGITYFYDFEFSLSIRGTGAYLHRREQEPCENALRFERSSIPNDLHLHTGFLNSKLRITTDPYSYFVMKFRVLEYRREAGFLWDYKYPSRQIYSESLEVKIGEGNSNAQYRWLSDMKEWEPFTQSANGDFAVPLRKADSLQGTMVLRATPWPDKTLTFDE